MLEMKVFRSDQKTHERDRYIEGHHKVLAAYGVTQITSADLDWVNEPYSYLIVAIDSITGEMMGGGRIQLAGGKSPLPIETAIDTLDLRIYEYVKEKAKKVTGEYCGLWNSKKIAGFGVGSRILMRAGAAILEQLKMGSIMAFVSPATKKRVLFSGFQVITSLGNEGTFYYPKNDLLATALILNDPLVFEHAHPKERERIFDLRNNPTQRLHSKGPKGEIEIAFNLIVPPIKTTEKINTFGRPQDSK